jgi:hypothetical protein
VQEMVTQPDQIREFQNILMLFWMST